MKTKTSTHLAITDEKVISKIYHIRSKRIMLDSDLAQLYNVETKVLNQAVKRNMLRFPEDFMFTLTETEWEILRSQFVTSKSPAPSDMRGGRRTLPFAFTEQGIAMLSSILNSETAILVNIQIIRVFTRMRELLSTHKETLLKLEKIEKALLGQLSRLNKHDDDIDSIFNVLKELLQPLKQQTPSRKRIGFKSD
ncbi:MAG: ORF6N domain-containing protein [Bacteroidota bacterium]